MTIETRHKPKPKTADANRSALGFEATLWATAEQAVPAPNADATEYNAGGALALGLGLIFLKYNSDAFEERHAALQKEKGGDPEDRDFSLSASNGERAGRCRSLVPPAGNANFAWVHHFLHHFAPTSLAGFVLANGSM